MRLRSSDSRPSTSASDSVKPKGQTSLQEAFARGTAYDKQSKRWREITDAITIHLCKDMVPLQTVDKDGFSAMVKTLDPRYVMPGRKYFSKTAIPMLYEQHRSKLEAELRKVAHFSTTTDLWSSRTMEPYLSITVHFISDDWELRNHCLQTSYFPDDHTGEIIAQGLREALESWRLGEERQVALTTDSGPTS
ncbi:hypothetical protein VZT92_019675 [Zoarces viviparus]|uniref:Uncharacterized protein n=1 Tax=Zoarces viviparus TaxID=48416 RepID=A0AAW1EL72_ZOAVI